MVTLNLIISLCARVWRISRNAYRRTAGRNLHHPSQNITGALRQPAAALRRRYQQPRAATWNGGTAGWQHPSRHVP